MYPKISVHEHWQKYWSSDTPAACLLGLQSLIWSNLHFIDYSGFNLDKSITVIEDVITPVIDDVNPSL